MFVLVTEIRRTHFNPVKESHNNEHDTHPHRGFGRSCAYRRVALAHELDADQDGLFSLAEMQDEYTDLTQAQYDALDLNKDGALDAAELQAAIDSGKLPKMDDD